MVINKNIITVAAPKSGTVGNIASTVKTSGSGPVKSNFENLNPSTNIKIEGSAISIRPQEDSISIKPVGIVSTVPSSSIVTPIQINPVEVKTQPANQSAIISPTPIGIVSTSPNNVLVSSNVISIKTPSTSTVNTLQVKAENTITVKTKVYDAVAVLPNANIWVDGKAVAGSDINGNVELKAVNPESQVMFSYVGYKSATFSAKNVPAKVVLENDDMLNEVAIKNGYVAPVDDSEKKKLPSWIWLLVILTGAAIYGGYKYSQDKKTKKLVKTKI